jgi:hypothetical protein
MCDAEVANVDPAVACGRECAHVLRIYEMRHVVTDNKLTYTSALDNRLPKIERGDVELAGFRYLVEYGLKVV